MANPPLTAPARSHSDESGEPEDHGDELDSRDSILVRSCREAGRRKDQIGDNEKGPDGGEEHKRNASWYPSDVCINN